MSKLIISATKTTKVGKVPNTNTQTVVIESDKIVVLPREGTDSALIEANGYQFEVDAEVAEIAAAMEATDASTYT